MIEAVFGNSPFLAQCAASDPAALRDIVTEGPDSVVAAIMEGLEAARAAEHDDAALGRLLRIAKRRLALAVAMADIAGAWTLERVTGAMSDFAEAALSAAAAPSLAPKHPGRRLLATPCRRSGTGFGLGHSGHGQAGLAGAQLFKRHRSHRPLRPRQVRDGGCLDAAQPRHAPDPQPDQADGGADHGWLRISHRPEIAARSRIHPHRAVGRRRRNLLRKPGSELGTRRHDQGPAGGRRPRRRRGLPQVARSLHLAQKASTSRPSRISTRSSARSTSTAAAGASPSQVTTSSWGAAASARSNFSCRPSN